MYPHKTQEQVDADRAAPCVDAGYAAPAVAWDEWDDDPSALSCIATMPACQKGPPTFDDNPEVWEYPLPKAGKLLPYRYERTLPARPIVRPNDDVVFVNSTWATAWSYHRGAALRAELGHTGLRPTFVWMKDSAVAYDPYEKMADVESENFLDYMEMHAPWDQGTAYDLQEAIVIAKLNGERCRHFGYILAALFEPSDAMALPAMPAAIALQARQWTLMEFCCSTTSLLCQEYHKTPCNRLIRLTQERDMTSAKGLKYALHILKQGGVPVIHAALPCTWGSPMQSRNKRRLGTDEKYRAHMQQLYAQYTALIATFRKLATEVVRKQGGSSLNGLPITSCGRRAPCRK